jgi:hypothetical protein
MRTKRIVLLLVAVAFVSVLITIGSLLYRQPLRYADYEADRFGFPYYWIEHLTSTFAGRTDFWNIEILNFAVDFILFFLVGCVALCLILVWKSKRG